MLRGKKLVQIPFMSYSLELGNTLLLNQINQSKNQYGPLKIFQGVFKVNPIFTMTLRHYLPFSLYLMMEQVMVCKTASTLAQIMAVVPSYTSSHNILHCHAPVI